MGETGHEDSHNYAEFSELNATQDIAFNAIAKAQMVLNGRLKNWTTERVKQEVLDQFRKAIRDRDKAKQPTTLLGTAAVEAASVDWSDAESLKGYKTLVTNLFS